MSDDSGQKQNTSKIFTEDVNPKLDYKVDRAGNFEVPKDQVLAALRRSLVQTNNAMEANKKNKK